MSGPDEVFTAAQSLDPQVRLELIAKLWDSIPSDVWPVPPENDLGETQRRTAEEKAGRIETIAWSEHFETLKKRYADD